MARSLTTVLLEESTKRERRSATLLPDPEPAELWCPIISVDDHVLEPPNIFEDRVESALRDTMPRVEEGDQGVPFWVIDDDRLPITIGNGASGRPKSEWDNSAIRYDEVRPAVWQADARLRDMDLNGVWASLCFPSMIWGFAGSAFSKMRDARAGQAAMRAYNDWMMTSGAPTASDSSLAS